MASLAKTVGKFIPGISTAIAGAELAYGIGKRIKGSKQQGLPGQMAPGAATPDPSSAFYRQIGQKGVGQAMQYYGDILGGDPEALAKATGTTTSDIGRQLQRQTTQASRGMTRGGATAAILAEAPGVAESEAQRARLTARMGAAQQVGGLGMQAAGLGANIPLLERQLDLQRLQIEKAYRSPAWGVAGEAIGGVLSAPGMLERIGGIFKGGTKGGLTPSNVLAAQQRKVPYKPAGIGGLTPRGQFSPGILESLR